MKLFDLLQNIKKGTRVHIIYLDDDLEEITLSENLFYSHKYSDFNTILVEEIKIIDNIMVISVYNTEDYHR